MAKPQDEVRSAADYTPMHRQGVDGCSSIGRAVVSKAACAGGSSPSIRASGMWRNLGARLVWGQVVARSNRVIPTIDAVRPL